MAPEPIRKRRSPLGRFRRPLWRDGAFWASVVLTAILFAVQVALAGDREGWAMWAGLGLRLVVTWIVISSLMRIRVGMERGLVAGFTDADSRTKTADGPSAAEGAARTGGRLVGRAVKAYRDRDG